MQYRKEAHKLYSIYYHIIFVVKYRQQVFLEDHNIINDTKEKIKELSKKFDVKIVEIECGIDHVHLLIRTKTILEIPKWINSIKSNTSRFLREKQKNFLRDKLWWEHFWSPSYFIATTRNVSIDVLKKYIEQQREKLTRED
ncbi:MAG: IS200/IS605 family transposase [Candidatus Ranarchaeia archaeon]